MIFFDGWGLGANDPATNPFLTHPMPTLRGLFDGKLPTNDNGRFESSRATLVPTDATLGVPGLPQSATGQTTIFTGVNASREIGEHLGPYPNAALRRILAQDNIFQRLVAANRRAAFANAYPPIFFERLARGKARRSALTVLHAAAEDLIRLLSPVLSFTMREAWSHLPGRSADSVFLAGLPRRARPAGAEALEARYGKLFDVRSQVQGKLEAARKAGLIGKSLEARVTVTAGGETRALLEEAREELAILFIVSQVALADGPLGVEVAAASGVRCERCWIYREDVGIDPTHPTVCGKCADALA